MVLSNRTKIVFKTISVLVAGVFLFNQIAWAGDLINAALEEQYKDQSQTFAPAYLQNQQTAAETLVTQKQDIQSYMATQVITPQENVQVDLKGPVSGSGAAPTGQRVVVIGPIGSSSIEDEDEAILNITTRDGDKVIYKDKKICSVERKDGTVITNIEVGESNDLKNAFISYPDGSIVHIMDGSLFSRTVRGGTDYYYDTDGLVKSSRSGITITSYSYVKDGQGNVIETILSDPDKTIHYGSDNRIKKVGFAAGKSIEYESAVISKITEADGGAFIFDIKQNADSGFTASLSQYQATNGTIYRYSIDNDPSVSVIVQYGGATATYNKDGALLNITKDGKALTADAITEARVEYDAAVVIYKQREQATQNCQSILNNASTGLANKTAARNAALTTLNAALQSFNNAQSARSAKQAAYNTACSSYLSSNSTYNSANAALTAAKTAELQAQRNLANAKSGIAAKQTAYNNAVRNRQAKEILFNAAKADLSAKAAAKVRANAELQTAIQNLSSAQTAKNKSQTFYNLADKNYLPAKAAYDKAATDLNSAKSNEAAAKAMADSFSASLDALIYTLSLFPLQDKVLADADKDSNIAIVAYDAERQVQQVKKMDGSTQNYTDGLIKSSLTDSEFTSYNYDMGALNTINGVTIDREGIKSIYDQYGRLASIIGNGVSMALNNGKIVRVEKEDGTIIENALFDSNDSIISATITNPDGVKAIYEGGVVREVIQPDDTKLYYDVNGKMVRSISGNGIAYNYTQANESGVVHLIATAEKDGAVIDYIYIKDASGKIISTIANDGKVVTTYDGNNNTQKTEVLPTSDEPVSTISEYEYNRIRRVYKGNDLIYRYTYEFDGSGKEITVIEDVGTSDIKRYKDEVLISVTDKDGLVTAYEYNGDNKISKSTIAYLGKIMNKYEYAYDGDNAIITDIDGVKRTYNNDDKLIFLEESGKTYAYAYNVDSNGKEETVQELIRVKDETGAIANYEGGALASIIKPDGDVLSDFVMTNDVVSAYMLLKDETKYFIELDKVTKSIRPSGTIIEYCDNGQMGLATSPDGKKTSYSYEYSTIGEVEYITAKQGDLSYRYDKNGAFLELIDDKANHYFYDSANRLVRLIDTNNKTNYLYEYSGDATITNTLTEKIYDIGSDLSVFDANNLNLSDKVELVSFADMPTKVSPNYYRIPDIGTGSDGIKNITTNETLSAGTYNYTSLTIDAGKTLTVAPGTTIKCLGTITVNGVIRGTSNDISAHTITIGANGAIAGSGQHLRANTINNAALADVITESYGPSGSSYDGNYGTYIGQGATKGGRGDFRLGPYCVTTEYIFGSPKTITQIDYRSYSCSGHSNLGDDGNWWGLFIAQGGSYIQLWGGSGDSGHVTQSGVWEGVTKLELFSYATAGGDRDGRAEAYNYELQYKSPIITYDYVNSTGNIPASAKTSDYTNALNYYVNGWIGVGGVRADIASQVSGSSTLLDALYYGDRIYNPNGVLTSDPIAINATNIDSITANTNTPAGTTLKFKTRTGVSSDLNDGSWSEWAEAVKDVAGYKINSFANKYIQYQAILETTDITKTPSIYSNGEYAVKLNYSYNNTFDATALEFTPPNLPISPQIDKLKVDSSQFKGLPAEIEARVLPDDAVIQTKNFKDDAGHDVALQISKDDKFTYMVDGKIMSVHQKYDDSHVELLAEYVYNDGGDLMNVKLSSARNSLDSEIAKARQQIAQERANYLRTLAQQKGLAYTQISDQVQAVRGQISAQRSQLQSQLYQEVTKSKWVGWWIFGWWETYRETVEVPGVRDAINQLNEQERQLNDQESSAYAQLNNEVSAAESKLMQDEASALTQISYQEKSFQAQIIKEEATPVILDCYRSILGRDPDESETDTWLATVNYSSVIDAGALRTALFNSGERQVQEAFVVGLKDKIKDALYNYLELDEAGKGSLLGTLGLTSADCVGLSKKDVDAVLFLLDEQNIHFGKSAFVALETLLKEKNITYSLDDLALKAVLVDIFTGTLNSFSEGKLLELSIYSLSKTASTYGLTLYNTKLDFNDLSQVFTETGKAIAHLKNNHFVVVTNIASDGKISYVERNRGKDGYTWTMSKDDFLKGWTGYAILNGTLPSWLASRVISTETAQRVKGSCLPFLFPLIGAIFGAIVGATTAVVGAISAIVTGISAILGPIITGIGAVISGVGQFMAGIGAQVFGAIQFVGSSLLSALGPVGTWLAGIGSTVFGSSGLGGIISATGFSLTGIGSAIAQTVVTTALSIGLSKGLEALGVNSTISSILSSFVTGGVSGIFNSGFSALSFITGGMQGVAIQGVNALSARLGIDPMLSNVISLGAGSFIGAIGKNISPTTGQFNLEGFSASIKKEILPNISSEFAYYGVTKAGELLGVDPRISYLAGVSIRSSLQAGLISSLDPGAIWNGVVNGLLRGGTSIGLQWAYQELDMDPILGSLSAAALTGAVEGLLEGQGAIKGVYDTLFKTGKGLLTLGGNSDNAWAQALYISQVIDFSSIIQERGVVDALETYAAGFLHQNAIENIWKMGGIADLVTNKSEVVVNEEGVTVKRVYINPERTDFIDFSLAMDDMVGYKQGNVLVDCPIEIGPDGCPTTDNGKVKVSLGGKSRIIYNIKDHNLTLIEYIDANGETIAFAQPLDGEKSIKMNKDDNLIRTGRFYNKEKQLIVDKRDNQVFRILATPKSDMTEAQLQQLLSDGVEGDYLDGVTIEYDKNSNQIKIEIDPDAQRIGEFEGKTTFLSLISVNGISSEFGKYAAPTYEEILKYRLSSQGVDENAIYLLPMFEGYGLPMTMRTIKDIGLWFLDNAGTNILTSELIAKLDREIYGHILPGQQYEPKVMVLYSGSANSFFKAINKRHDYVIRDAIVLGGPTLDGMFEETTITNPNLDRVFNICGTKDVFYPVVSNKKYSSNVTAYNIEILDATHSDYFYEPAGDSLNARSSYFVEKLLEKVYTNGSVESLLIGPGVTYDPQKKKYVVDPYAINYEPNID